MAKITAVASLGWAHYTLYQALPRIQARGFKRVEITSFSIYCFHFNFGTPGPTELRRMLDTFGLQPISLNYFPGGYDAWRAEEIDRFEQDMTRKLRHLPEVGIPMTTMSFGMRNQRPDQETQLANAVKAFDRVGAIAERLGVRMLLEVPHLYSIWSRPEQVLWIFERLQSPNIGALIDSSHWGVIGYDMDAFVDALGPRLWHIHLRDSRGPDTADGKQELELTPGKGIVDFAKLARTLDRIGYSGDVALDFEYRDMTLEDIEQEYDAGLHYLEQVGWELPDTVKQ